MHGWWIKKPYSLDFVPEYMYQKKIVNSFDWDELANNYFVPLLCPPCYAQCHVSALSMISTSLHPPAPVSLFLSVFLPIPVVPHSQWAPTVAHAPMNRIGKSSQLPAFWSTLDTHLGGLFRIYNMYMQRQMSCRASGWWWWWRWWQVVVVVAGGGGVFGDQI